MIDLKEIDKLSALSRIDMSLDEKKDIQKDLEDILGYVSEIQSVAVNSEEYSGDQVDLLHNVMREDIHTNKEGVYTEKIIKSAPKSEGGYIKVKKILE